MTFLFWRIFRACQSISVAITAIFSLLASVSPRDDDDDEDDDDDDKSTTTSKTSIVVIIKFLSFEREKYSFRFMFVIVFLTERADGLTVCVRVSQELSEGALVGIIVGIAIFVLLFIALLVFCVCRRNRDATPPEKGEHVHECYYVTLAGSPC